MIRTARQVKEFDIIGQPGGDARYGVTQVHRNEDTGMFAINVIDAGARRTTVTLHGNDRLEVLRPDLGEVDPTNNPYWWGMELEHEMQEGRRQYEHEMMIASMERWEE